MRLPQSALTLQRVLFGFTPSDKTGRSCCGGKCAVPRCWSSLPTRALFDRHRGLCRGTLRARELTKLGHEVRLVPPGYVKPYVKRGKTDAIDAEAICEAVTRPNMRFVPAKTEDQQAAQMRYRTRDFLVRYRTRDFLVRQQTQLSVTPQLRFQRNATFTDAAIQACLTLKGEGRPENSPADCFQP